VVACAWYFGSCGYFWDLHGLPPRPPHLRWWFIGGYIPAHHGVRVTGLMPSSAQPDGFIIRIIEERCKYGVSEVPRRPQVLK